MSPFLSTDPRKWRSFDVETQKTVPEGLNYALQPYRARDHTAKIRVWSTSWIENKKLHHKAYPNFDRYQVSQFLQRAAENDTTLIVWKGTFDVAWLIAYGLVEDVKSCNWLDAMIIWKNYDRQQRKYSLKEAVRLFFPRYAGYEDSIDYEGDIELLLQYVTIDTDMTLLLALKFWAQLEKSEKNSLLIDMQDIPYIAERNIEGIYLNIAGVKTSAQMLYKKRIENLKKLAPHLQTIGEFYKKGGKLKNTELKKRFPTINFKDACFLEDIKHYPAINLDSDKQVADLLHNIWGLPVHKMTPKGAISVDKECLLEISHLDERAKWLQQYRETTGLISKCIKAVIKTISYNNEENETEIITRPELNKAGTVTDRCTYSSFQNSK